MIKFFKELETELKLRGYSNQTIKTYILQNQKFLEFAIRSKSEFQKSLLSKDSKRSAQDITQADIKAYLAHLISDKGQSPATTNLIMASLKFFYSDVLKKDFFSGIRRQKTEKKLPVVLTKDEIRLMIDLTKNKRHKLLIELLYSSGLRVGEAVAIRVNDFHLDEKTAFIKYGKGKKERFVKLSTKFIKHLQSHLKKRKSSSIYLFNSRKEHLTTRQAQRIVKNAAFRADIKKKVFCHALRSSYATHLLDSGTDIRVIQDLLGHSNLATTEIYTAVSKQRIMDVKSPLDSL